MQTNTHHDDAEICGDCYWFDCQYHDGYCDRHHIEVKIWQPKSLCPDNYWRQDDRSNDTVLSKP